MKKYDDDFIELLQLLHYEDGVSVLTLVLEYCVPWGSIYQLLNREVGNELHF